MQRSGGKLDNRAARLCWRLFGGRASHCNCLIAGLYASCGAKAAGLCAWASLQFDDAAATWVNASVALTPDSQGLVLSAQAPAGSTKVVASSYAWGAVPFMTVYLAEPGTDLPVQAWKA